MDAVYGSNKYLDMITRPLSILRTRLENVGESLILPDCISLSDSLNNQIILWLYKVKMHNIIEKERYLPVIGHSRAILQHTCWTIHPPTEWMCLKYCSLLNVSWRREY